VSAESFFEKWSRRNAKTEEASSELGDAPLDAENSPDAGALSLNEREESLRTQVTLEDVANLTQDSDYSPFVARGVDEDVKRSAMKKLFTDPHYNVMDGLDIYIDDYSKFEPITPKMLALMNHAKALLDPLPLLAQRWSQLADIDEHPVAQAAAVDEEVLVSAEGVTCKAPEPEADHASTDADTASEKPPCIEPETGSTPDLTISLPYRS
jgi:hypothetical protein